MSGIVFTTDTPEVRYKFNKLARHQLICKLYRDILTDMMVCELEGWDKTEFVNELYDCLSHFKKASEGGEAL